MTFGKPNRLLKENSLGLLESETSLPSKYITKRKTMSTMNNSSTRPRVGIAVDCSVQGGNPGKGEFRGIDLQTGKIIFEYKIPGITTNNIVEFFALVKGVNYLLQNKMSGKVYSDSMTALSWYRKRKHKCTLVSNENTIISLNQLKISMGLIPKENHMEYVEFWLNRTWGETPADYGRK